MSFTDPKVDSSVHESLSKLDRALLFCEFFECWVHQVLYARRLYDGRLFETKRLYDLFLKKSLYPKLNSYIHDTVYTLKVSARGRALTGEVSKIGCDFWRYAGDGRDPLSGFPTTARRKSHPTDQSAMAT